MTLVGPRRHFFLKKFLSIERVANEGSQKKKVTVSLKTMMVIYVEAVSLLILYKYYINFIII